MRTRLDSYDNDPDLAYLARHPEVCGDCGYFPCRCRDEKEMEPQGSGSDDEGFPNDHDIDEEYEGV